MKIFLYPNVKKHNALLAAKNTAEILLREGFTVFADEKFRQGIGLDAVTFGTESELMRAADIVVAIGGDGTLLECAMKILPANTPVLGMNCGRLGFMCSVEASEAELLPRLKNGYRIEKRMLLDVRHISRQGERVYTALNDIVIASEFSRLCDFDLLDGDGRITSVRADGVVFSTPTGSTAYFLSAGGPIIEPSMECIGFVPICPHSLFARPMIFPAEKILSVKPHSGGRAKIYFCADGGENIPVAEEDRLIISRSGHYVNLIVLKEGAFFSAVNEKLMRSIKG